MDSKNSQTCFGRRSVPVKRARTLITAFLIANCFIVCSLSGQDKGQVLSPLAVHAVNSEDARRSIQKLQANSRILVPLRLQGTIVLQDGTVPRSGKIIVDVSEKSDWRETVTIDGQVSTESHIRGVRRMLSRDGQQKSFTVPQTATDLLPIQTVLRRANDTTYAVANAVSSVGTQSGRSRYVIRPKASIGAINLSGNRRNSSALDFASFEADLDSSGSKVEAIRRFSAVLPEKPEYASFCRDKDGNPLAHPALKGIPADVDCSSFQKLVSIPIETRYSDYSPSDFGLIPHIVERYTLGKLTASIHIMTIEPLVAPFPYTEEKH